ncbi:hypothetical protein [Hamadaea tsunoensis]|uniref:hypothetical protein n=1 Tax=Hamadaea tsunoensis TaxID=53368 RepID=UPI000406A28D|nr:hypothetical protein [Hamadaea tsunoensis]
MPVAKKRINLLIAAVAAALTFSGLVAGCGPAADGTAPKALSASAATSETASASPSASDSASPSPAAVPSPTTGLAKVTTPSKPAPKPSTKKPTPKASPTPKPPTTHTHSGTVVPGAYCPASEHGWYGISAAGNRYQCSQYSNGQWRWKRV